MIRATAVIRRPAVRDERVVDTLILDHQARHRRRFAFTAEGGLAFLLDLDKATVLDDGDAVKLEDGRLVRIEAAPEQLIEVTAGSPLRLMKVVWHLGNRHVPTEITEDAVYIAEDHVLAEMVRGLGAGVSPVRRPFRPEKGAYAGTGDDDHGHHHHHEHAHGHHHEHAHEHGEDRCCGHGHGHRHGHGGDCCHDHADEASRPAGHHDHNEHG